jgi:succinate-semialdehyde dehydrogenase / glutarate-semialdehyde dehydrogenase
MSLQSIQPVNGQLLKTYPEHTSQEAEDKVKQTHAAWERWKETSFRQRADLLKEAASVLRARKQELAALMASEMGKPVKAGEQEIEKCAAVCDYYAENGEQFLRDEIIETGARKSYVSFQPLGVVLAIMPWNFPFWQVFRFLAPGLMAGNCALLKHASNVPGCALAIEEIIKEAGFPDHVFQTLLVGSPAVAQIIAHPKVKAVTLTGSEEAGRKVGQQAASYLKKSVLELGGSDPYVVLEDADLEKAAAICVESRLINGGQSCIAAKRFIVVREVLMPFTQLMKEKMAAKVWGDPFDEKVHIGPLARADLRDAVHQQVLQSIGKGAKCILGGYVPEMDGKHAFYPPTILTDVRRGMPAYDEEVFGPVAAIMSAEDEQDAIRIANDTSFGLGAAVFTQNPSRGEEIAKRQLNAGSCFVNDLVRSDPRLPFGGVNHSGYGRELGSYGIHEFVNIKTVYIQ